MTGLHDPTKCEECGFDGDSLDDFGMVSGGSEAALFECPECGNRFAYGY